MSPLDFPLLVVIAGIALVFLAPWVQRSKR